MMILSILAALAFLALFVVGALVAFEIGGQALCKVVDWFIRKF